MSCTSEALDNWWRFEHKRPLWSAKLVDFVRSDFPVAPHLAVSTGEPVTLTCGRCNDEITALSAHMVGMFCDHHNHCGDSLVELWRCPECNSPEFAERRHCRICEHENTGVFFRGSRIAPIELRERFEVERDGTIAARYEVNSLREALRCARAQFPHEQVAIRFLDQEFEVSHAAK